MEGSPIVMNANPDNGPPTSEVWNRPSVAEWYVPVGARTCSGSGPGKIVVRVALPRASRNIPL